MTDKPTTCRYCGEPLIRIHVENRPNYVELCCASGSCEMGWINQASQCNGRGTVQITLGEKGIRRLDHRSVSQGEDNCQPVADALLAWLEGDYKIGKPCPAKGAKRDSTKEEGFDFTIREPCGHETEVQVTRVPEKDYFKALAIAQRTGSPVCDQRSHHELVDLIKCAVRKKTVKTTPEDRAVRILAIDGRCPSIGLTFFLTSVRIANLAEDFGWRSVVLVDDNLNTRLLDGDRWPDCPYCK